MNAVIVGIQPCPVVRRAKSLPPWEADSYPHVFQPVPLLEALEREWETDAHFVPYFVEGEEEWPAMAKNMLGLIQQAGSDVKTQLLVLDFDTAPHKLWSDRPGLLEQFSDRMEQIRDEEKIPFPQIIYTTSRGARGVFVLSEPVSVAQAEPLTRGLVQAWGEALSGIAIHTDNLHNWDRCFRLPKVVRDGRETHHLRSFHLIVASDQVLFRPDDLPSLGPEACTRGGSPDHLDAAIPTPEEVDRILWESGARGRKIQTEWRRLAKSRLRGRDYYKACFEEGHPPPPEGQRDTAIQQAAGGVVAMCIGLAEATPERCYALLFDWVDQIHPSTCKMPPRENLWRAVLKYWAKEEAKREAEEEEQLSTIDQIVKGIRSYDPHVPRGQEDAREYASSRMLAYSSRTTIYLIQRNGFYEPYPTDSYILRSHIQNQGMHDFIALEEVRGDRVVDLAPHEILERHGFKLVNERSQMGLKGAQVAYTADGQPELVHPIAKERDLIPEYHPEIDAWLHRMFDRHYPYVEQWLANAVDLSEGMPICALSIVGPPGCGKGLLVRGLSECFDPSTVVGPEAFQQFNEPLLHSAIVCIDEGFPASVLQRGGAQDVFRSLVSGEPALVQRKNRPSVEYRGAPRVLMTSNGPNLLEAVVGDSSLSWEDSMALGRRLLHVQASASGSSFLEGLGGINHTAKRGARWVAPPGSGKSDFLVAKHIYWLRENRLDKKRRGTRFLTEGDPLADYLQDSKVVSAEGDSILSAIMSLVNGRAKEAYDGYSEDPIKGGIWVTPLQVAHMAERHGRKVGSMRAVSKTLKSFGDGTPNAKTSMLLPNGKYSTRKNFYFLDGEVLLRSAATMGYDTSRLEKLVRRNDG